MIFLIILAIALFVFIILGLLISWTSALLIMFFLIIVVGIVSFFLNLMDKYNLNKIRRNYNEEKDESRPPSGFIRSRTEGIERKSHSTRPDDELTKRAILQDDVTVSLREDKQELREHRRPSGRNLRRRPRGSRR